MNIEDYLEEFKPTIYKLCRQYDFMKDYSFQDLYNEAVIVLYDTFPKIDNDFDLRQKQKYFNRILLGHFHQMYLDYIKYHNMTGLIQNQIEVQRQSSKKYYEAHKEELNQKRMDYYYEHKEAESERYKKYYEEHKKELNKKRNERRKLERQRLKAENEELKKEVELLRKEIEQLKGQGV